MPEQAKTLAAHFLLACFAVGGIAGLLIAAVKGGRDG